MIGPRRAGIVAPLLLLLPALAAADDPGSDLALSDLPAYRAALEEPATPAARAVPATFRELWDHPERYENRRVRVEGRVMRRFRQGAVGTFPPLAEVWAASPAGDPFCLVFPASSAPGRADAAPGASVRFEGTYLKRLRYQGGDAARLAPLIVGPRPPTIVKAAPRAPARSPSPARGPSQLEWTIGLTIAGLAALALARQHLRGSPRPRREAIRGDDPPPEFVDRA